MARQPLFVTVTDNLGREVQTRSRSGSVDSVRIWINSIFGEVATLTARLSHGSSWRPDLRKIPPAERDKAMQEYHDRISRGNNVRLSIHPNEDSFVSVTMGGIDFSAARACQEFLSDPSVMGPGIPEDSWAGIYPEYVRLMQEQPGTPAYAVAEKEFVDRKNQLTRRADVFFGRSAC